MPLQASSKVTPEDSGMFGECCPARINLVLVLVLSLVLFSQEELILDFLYSSGVDIVFHRHLLSSICSSSDLNFHFRQVLSTSVSVISFVVVM